MEFVGHPIIGGMLRNVQSKCIESCTAVRIAVPYADRSHVDFWKECARKAPRLEFYGRYDGTCPVDPAILRWFLDENSPSVSCRLVARWLHAKIIWWEGEGAYIGSANLTTRAWNSNFEAGVFFSDAELEHFGLTEQLVAYFEHLHANSFVLDEEAYVAQKALHDKIMRKRKDIDDLADSFDKSDPHVGGAKNPVVVSSATKDSTRYARFAREWNETLQHMRSIAERVSDPGVRPSWVDPSVPKGVQADQFLHAYYYLEVKDGLRHPFEDHYEKNKKNPEEALIRYLDWWHRSNFEHDAESRTIHQWAPVIRANFAKDKVLSLSESEWVATARFIHAIRDHGTKLPRDVLGSTDNHDEKIEEFCRWVWKFRSKGNKSVLDLIHYVVWGDGELTRRLWAGCHDDEWKIPHIKVSTLGEIIGWADPERYPPRNQRTSKGLRALGYNVAVSI